MTSHREAPVTSAPGSVWRSKPSGHRTLSIIASLVCFPLGVLGLYYSFEVSGRWAVGDDKGSLRASRLAAAYDILGIAIIQLLLINTSQHSTY